MKTDIEIIKEKLESIELKYNVPLQFSGGTTISMMKERFEKLIPILKEFHEEAAKAIKDTINENRIKLTEELEQEIKQEGIYAARRITRAVTGTD